jgi:type VI secretion system secreted protein Hcp
MREGFDIISGGKMGRLLLFGAVIALAAALAVTLANRNSPGGPTASADSLAAPSGAPSEAAYIKLGDIKGESTDDRHKDWIEVLSFSHSIAFSGSIATGGGGGAGKATVRDFTLVKTVDKASPVLMKNALSGTHIPTVEFEVTRASGDGDTTYLKYEFMDCFITNYRVSGSGLEGDQVPTESMSLNFAQIKVTYTEQKADGSRGEVVETAWDVKQNRAP